MDLGGAGPYHDFQPMTLTKVRQGHRQIWRKKDGPEDQKGPS